MNTITVVPGEIDAWRRSALVGGGGYSSDTLAEDMDLPWRVRRAGWSLANEPAALAFTEVPYTLAGLMRQRFSAGPLVRSSACGGIAARFSGTAG